MYRGGGSAVAFIFSSSASCLVVIVVFCFGCGKLIRIVAIVVRFAFVFQGNKQRSGVYLAAAGVC